MEAAAAANRKKKPMGMVEGHTRREGYATLMVFGMSLGAAVLVVGTLGSHLSTSLAALRGETPGAEKVVELVESPVAVESLLAVHAGQFLTEIVLVVTTVVAVLGLTFVWRRRTRVELDEVPETQRDCSEQRRLRILAKRQKVYAELSGHMEELFDERVTVERLMTRKVVTVDPAVRLEEVRATMANERLHHLLVEEDGMLVGVVSDRDLDSEDGDDVRVGRIMTVDPISVRPDTLLMEALSMFINHRISCLPVTNGKDEILGVLATTDVVLGFQAYLRAVSEMSGSLVDILDIALEDDPQGRIHAVDADRMAEAVEGNWVRRDREPQLVG